jgi:GH25 family lysozyme M1 (1,4-beta-N-acetylmuramidase)
VLHGIDVSSYQSSDYSTSGLSFVFIKLTEGMSYVNPKWTAQRTRARGAGLVTGFYHYPHIANSPTAEADHFLEQINLTAGDILCLDWEWYGQDVSNARARSYKDTWLSHVKSKAPAHRVVLYSDRSNWLNVDEDSHCGDGLWIADPTTAGHPRVKHHWTFHQYAESSADKDVANFSSAAALRSWAGAAKAAEEEAKAADEAVAGPATPVASRTGDDSKG